MELRQELADSKGIYLVLVSSESYFKTNSDILKIFCNERGMFSIYITLGKSYDVLMRQYTIDGVDTSKLFFIDAVSKKTERPKNTIFIKSPSSLTEISITISQLVSIVPSDKTFLYLDSLSTLALYNEPDMVIKFMHFLIARMREWQIAGIIIALDAEESRSSSVQLSQFCDKMIKVA